MEHLASALPCLSAAVSLGGAYGVPFDLVDTSQGSAMSEMLQQLQEADTALTAMNIMNQNVQAKE